MHIERRYPIQIGEVEQVQVVLVGCGGTGSFLALHLARLAYHARQRHDLRLDLTFIDPDEVELKNVGRQNFCPAEVGFSKAGTLAARYSRAFGISIQVAGEPFDHTRHLRRSRGRRPFTLIIGAVDNNAARHAIHRVFLGQQRASWWLDCGNHEHSGQILLGNRAALAAPEISPLGFCSGLPLPTVQHPELLDSEPELVAPESCAEMTLRDAQSLTINQMAASHAAEMVTRLLLSRDLDIYATYFDLAAGSARCLPITAGTTG